MQTSFAARLALEQYLVWEEQFGSYEAYTFTLGYVAGMVGRNGLTYTQYTTITEGTGRLLPKQFKEHLKLLTS